MELKDYLYIIKKRWFIFILVLLIVFGIHHLYVDQQEASYSGTSRIMITSGNNSVGLTPGGEPGFSKRDEWLAFQGIKASILSFPVLERAGMLLAGGMEINDEVKKESGKLEWFPKYQTRKFGS